ncbi:MAG: chromosome segregation protein SMC [Clostridia bacterium]|nr:chromosome segregation protein SMC [Clostridia bacterium]
MRLSKLEIVGFKSFAKKTEIQFSNGITAVIGPNGSGKSNIADAVRWVLGEQSAKALRGARMEDVIFNGTQTKRPQSYCEVTLTFENADHKLAVDYSEVSVTRRVYRSGESEYCLNGTTCRLKDILELFRDTGIGKDGYSIISQGKVDEILSNKSEDRRAALEEAAGVMRYRVRKEEAERKLAHTEKNMERILDILNELEARIEPLREQSETARVFMKLRDELKDLEINVYLYQTDKHRERLSGLKKTIEQLDEELIMNSERDKALIGESRSLEEAAQKLDSELSRQQDVLLGLLSVVEAKSGDCKLLLERRENLKRERARIGEEIEHGRERLRLLNESLSLCSSEHPDDAKRARLEDEINAKNLALESFDRGLAEDEEAVERLKNEIMEAMNRLSDARSDLSRLDAMQDALNSRLSALDNDETDAKRKLESLSEELKQAQAEARALEKSKTDAEEAQRRAREDRANAEKKLIAVQNEHREQEQKLGALESRLRILREMIKSREGYQNSVRFLMRDAQTDAKLKVSVRGVVAELISVPKELETAIDITLGGSLQNVVTETAEDAKACIEHLRSKGYGRATFLPLSLIHPTPLTQSERAFLKEPGVLGLASELVTADKSLLSVLEYLLGRTVIVKDLDSGIRLKQKSKNAFHIATLQGDFISTGGTMSGGGGAKKHFGLLGREREVRELSQETVKLMGVCDELQQDIEREKEKLKLLDVQLDAFTSEIHKISTELAVASEKRDIILRDAEKAEAELQRLNEERADIIENFAELEARKAQSATISSDIDRQNTASREDVIRAQRALGEKRVERDRLSGELTELLVTKMALEKEADAREAERKRLQKEDLELRFSLNAYNEQLAATDRSEAELNAELETLERGLSNGQGEVNRAKEEQTLLEKKRTEMYESLSRFRQERDRLSEEYRGLGERKHKNELTVSRLEMELVSMQDRIWEDYELTYDNAQKFKRDFTIGGANARIAELRAEIRELGDINISSIEDYRSVTERFETLNTQYSDLLKAKEDLHTLINQLTTSMEEVFSTEFQKVQRNFGEVFAQLFGGGHAELRLSDPKNALSCDIDIIAQPPGKKLQLLSLLSGGERALTAIALLFAMLKLKAPAFCVLDEIETSLDEANVGRFADYLKAYAADTQFIIITHRKGSMEVCDSLYGVAMEEKGISTIVSAKFEEAS